MAEQKADTQQLNSLVQTLGALTEYCGALQSGATSFAYSLPGDWSGPAFTRFQHQFQSWAAGATIMTGFAEGLQKQADAAYKGYDSAIDAESTRWGKGSGTTVKLDAARFESEAEVFREQGDKIYDALSQLFSDLHGTEAMAGDSDLGEAFANGPEGYMNSARALVEGAQDIGESFYDIHGNLVNTARAYGAAQTAGTGSPKQPDTYAVGHRSVGGSIPEAYGDGGTAFWDLGEFDNWIQDGLDAAGVHLPSGDVDKLRKAASAWRSFANALSGAYSFSAHNGIPQASGIDEITSDADKAVASLIENANALADFVSGTADGLQQTKDAIADIITQMIIEIGIEIGVGVVVSIFTAGLAAGPAAAGIMARIGVFVLRILSKVKTLARIIDNLKDVAKVLSGMRKTRMALNALKDGTIAVMASSGSKLVMNNTGLHSDSYKQQDVFGLDELGAFVGGFAGTGITDLAKGANPNTIRKIAAAGAGGAGGGALGEYAKAAVPGGKSVNGVHSDALAAGLIGGVTNVAFAGLGAGIKSGINTVRPTPLNPINTPTPSGAPGSGPTPASPGGTTNIPDSPSANAGGSGSQTPGGSGGPGRTDYDGPTSTGAGDPGTGAGGDGTAPTAPPEHVDVDSHQPAEFENPDVSAPGDAETPDLPGSLGDGADPVDPVSPGDSIETPEAPLGMTQTESGLYVPEGGLVDGSSPLPEGFGTSDGGLAVPEGGLTQGIPDLPDGLGRTDGGLIVPDHALDGAGGTIGDGTPSGVPGAPGSDAPAVPLTDIDVPDAHAIDQVGGQLDDGLGAPHTGDGAVDGQTGDPDGHPAGPEAAAPQRPPLPHETDAQFGDGWHRVESPAEANPIDPDYGNDRGLDSGHLADEYTHPGAIDPKIQHLVDTDPADPSQHVEPYGHDQHVSDAPLTREQYEARYTNEDGRSVYPGNAGGEPGSFIHYTDVDAFTRDYGSQIDRFGGGGGDYFGLPTDSFESRSLPPSNLNDPYTVLDVQALPHGWSIEVSKIAPAFGRDGGGTQFRILDQQGRPVPMDHLTSKGRDADIDEALKIIKSVIKRGIKAERKIEEEAEALP